MIDRREFLKVTALASGAFVIGVNFAGCASPQKIRREKMLNAVERTGEFRPNAFITITPDDRVVVAVEKSEMGQGVLTSHAMLVAEELEVDLDNVEAYSADAAPEYATSFGMQLTGGSTSTKESFIPIRKAAAAARIMLVGAAAQQWGVSTAELEVAGGSIRHARTGREATYGALAANAASQPIPSNPPIKDPSDFKVLGKAKVRVDAREKVDGSAVFGLDVVVPGMVKAYIVRPPVMGSSPASFDGSEARKESGVVDIISFERGVAVLAEKFWQARRAAAKLEVQWAEAPTGDFNTSRIRRLAERALERPGESTFHEEGDYEQAMQRGDVRRVEAIYEAPFLAHAPMEPMNCTAYVRGKDVEIWAPTQAPTICQEVGARIAGTRRDRVKVHVTLLGGGFGRRSAPDFVAEAVELSRRSGKPVQVIWSREDDTRGGYYRPYALTRMQGAVDNAGRPVAWRYHSVSQPISTDFTNWISVAFPEWMPKITTKIMTRSAGGLFRSGVVPEFISAEGARELSYGVPHQSIEFTPLQTTFPVCFWRSVGHSYNGFIVESFIDELAHAAGEDPYEFRRKNMKDERLRAVLDRAAEESGWGEPLEDGYARGIAAHFSFDSYVAQVVEARLDDEEIDIRRVTCVIDCGIALNPDIVKQNMESSIIFGLSAAMMQKITVEGGVVQQGNFDDFPLMRMHQTPKIDVHIIDSNESPTGVGEPGLPPVAPALANAIFAASGVRLRKMPFDDALAEHFGDTEG